MSVLRRIAARHLVSNRGRAALRLQAFAAGFLATSVGQAQQQIPYTWSGYHSNGQSIGAGQTVTANVSAGVFAYDAGVFSGAGTLAKAGAGTLVLIGTNTYTGGTTLLDGKLEVSAISGNSVETSRVVFAGDSILKVSAATEIADITLNAGVRGTLSTAGTLKLFGFVNGGAGSTLVIGEKFGGTGTIELTRSASQAFLPALNIAAGTLRFSDTTVARAGRITTVEKDATLEFNNGFTPPHIQVGSLFGEGTVSNTASSTAELTVFNGGNFSGQLTGKVRLNLMGGTLTLAGNNTHQGNTIVDSATLVLGSANALGTGSLILANGTLRAAVDATVGQAVNLGFAAGTIDTNGHALALSGPITGTYGLTKIGAGTLSLTGSNTFSGGLTIGGGVLAVGSDAALGALGSAITLDGGTLRLSSAFILGAGRALTINSGGGGFDTNGFDAVVGNSIAGTGIFTKAGAGTLTIDGQALMTGLGVEAGRLLLSESAQLRNGVALEVDGGTLDLASHAITAGRLSGDGGEVTWTSNLTLNQTGDTTFDGNLSGATLVKQGAGTLTLGGNVNAALVVSAGALKIASSAVLAPGTSLTLNNGRFELGTSDQSLASLSGSAGELKLGGGRVSIAQAFDTVFSGSITGAGAFEFVGPGRLQLSGSSSYVGDTTISGGTVELLSNDALPSFTALTIKSGATLEIASGRQTQAGSLQGGGRLLIQAGASLDLRGNDTNANFTGQLAGVGQLAKSDSGVQTLSGSQQAFFGSLTVTGGGLVVNGDFGSAPVIVQGGFLGGSGVVGGLTVSSGAVAPGNSIGTLTVNGTVSFASGSFYDVEVNAAGASDRIVASGSASLDGFVRVHAEIGPYGPSTEYTILTYGTERTGTFAGVTSNFAFLTPSLHYDDANRRVLLTLSRAVDSSGKPTPFGSIGLSLNQTETGRALESMGANTLTNAILRLTPEEARKAFDQLSGEAVASGQATTITQVAGTSNVILSHLRQPLAPALPSALTSLDTVPLSYASIGAQSIAPLTYSQPSDVSAWGQVLGAFGRTSGDANAAPVERRTGGFVLGIEAGAGGSTRLGIAGAYTRSSFEVDDRFSSGVTESTHVFGYGATSFGMFNVRGGAGVAQHDGSTVRSAAFRGFSGSVTAETDAHSMHGFAEAGYEIRFSQSTVEPFFGLSVLSVSSEAFQEHGGIMALHGKIGRLDLTSSTLGVRTAIPLVLDGGLSFHGTLAWRHVFQEIAPSALVAFASGSPVFGVRGAPIDQNALMVETGVDWLVTRDVTLGLVYEGELSRRDYEHTFKGQLSARF